MKNSLLVLLAFTLIPFYSYAQMFGGQLKSAKVGSITTLNCASITNSGTLTAGTTASGVSSSVPYTGGNGGAHNGQAVSSTGVTGLTAILAAGTFANGAGSLTYNIIGTPSAAGIANFALNIGGQSCTLSINVLTASSPAYPPNSVFCANGPTSVVDVTNPATGRIWMDRNLGATQAATSSTDANSYGDLYQWGRRSDGHQCRTSPITSTLSSIDQPGHGNFILVSNLPIDWRSPQNNNLWQGMNGVNNPCPSGYRLPTEPELEAERLSWSSNNFTGAFASPLKLTCAGVRSISDGSLIFVGTFGNYWSSAVSGVNSVLLSFNSNNANMGANSRGPGATVRCLKDVSSPQGSINTIDCASATNNGTLTSGTAASGVSSSVPYTGGNGVTHNGQTVTSSGVTGLTATLSAGTFANGSGSLTYTISGTPASTGTASFALSIGGQSCTLSRIVNPVYPIGTVHCSTPTAIVEVTNPSTGRIWMDRNLGAQQIATSSADQNAYGDLYQWGRRADGHQCRNSQNISTASSTDQPPHGFFIVANTGNFDWRSPQNSNLWQGVNGINNPCPTGYRIPTLSEWDTERSTWFSNNSFGALASSLKLSNTGSRIQANGMLNFTDLYGYYWSSSIGATDALGMYFGYANNSGSNFSSGRGGGHAVRCIKDNTSSPQGSINTIDCGSATNNGTLTQGTAASGVSSIVLYTGGNGGTHNGQTVTSTGVTGLTATLAAGTFANGAGSLTYTITGTPSASGTASFALNIGGQSCPLSRTANTGGSTASCGATNVHNPNLTYGSMTDQDGNVYKTIVIGTQEWMAENLKASNYRNGDLITNVTDSLQWTSLTSGAWCYLNNDSQYECPYGKLYNWYTVVDPRNVCPTSWHVPTDIEWSILVSYLGGETVAGGKMKTIGTQYWLSPNIGAFNESGFSGLPGGSRFGNVFAGLGGAGQFWSSTELALGSSSAFIRELIFDEGKTYKGMPLKYYGYSVRCIKD